MMGTRGGKTRNDDEKSDTGASTAGIAVGVGVGRETGSTDTDDIRDALSHGREVQDAIAVTTRRTNFAEGRDGETIRLIDVTETGGTKTRVESVTARADIATQARRDVMTMPDHNEAEKETRQVLMMGRDDNGNDRLHPTGLDNQDEINNRATGTTATGIIGTETIATRIAVMAIVDRQDRKLLEPPPKTTRLKRRSARASWQLCSQLLLNSMSIG